MSVRSLVSCLTLMLAAGCTSSSHDEPISNTVPPGRNGSGNDVPIGADAPPNIPAISGGTLLVTGDGQRAVAADPDRDRVSIVSLAEGRVLATIHLTSGDEPGRVVEDSAGRLHVALRRGGAIVSIDGTKGTIIERRSICGAPRGIAYDASSNQLHVACASGQLVSLSADGGPPLRRLELGVDLRDVVVQAGSLLVSRFKSAEVIRIDGQGKQIATISARGIKRATKKPPPPGSMDPTIVVEAVEPDGAYRMVARGNAPIVLHQYALAEPIQLDDPSQTAAPQEQRPYGAPISGCGGLVQPAISSVDPENQFHMGQPIMGPVLAVDTAVSPDNRWIAVAHAGPPAFQSTELRQAGPSIFGLSTVTILDADDGNEDAGAPLGADAGSSAGSAGDGGDAGPASGSLPCKPPTFAISVAGQATAVAFNPTIGGENEMHNTWFVVQTREPAQLIFYRDPMGNVAATVDLGGGSMFNTGHELFHRDVGTGIACASCHLEGAEDGRVWKFLPIGNRRTQSLDSGIAGTAPFHWDGDMTDFPKLMDEVFVHRMGGLQQSPDRVSALFSWISNRKPPAAIRTADDPAVSRGHALFVSSQIGCASCHSGAKFTNNLNTFVGTTEAGHTLQVPGLVGVGYRAPFLHNGCAKTLRERFDPACGGAQHGNTAELAPAQIDDLVAYLESL